MKALALNIFIMALLMGCSKQQAVEVPVSVKKLDNLTVYPAKAKPSHQIQLIKDRTYGQGSEALIGRFGDIVVDSVGRVYIADSKQDNNTVYKPSGHFLAFLGRKGA